MKVSPGLIFFGCVVGIAALALTDITMAQASLTRSVSSGPFQSNTERAVFTATTNIPVGSRLTMDPELAGDAWPSGLTSYDFRIVPGGDGALAINGTPPRAVYLEIKNISSQTCCPIGFIAWTRPDDALAHRTASVPPETGPGVSVNMTQLAFAAHDRPEAIDFVWEYHWKPGAKQPNTPEERATFDEAREASLGHRIAYKVEFDPGHPTVFSPTVIRWHPVIFDMMAFFSVVASGAAIAWAMQLRQAQQGAHHPGTEELLRLYESAGTYLRSTRDLLIGSLIVVMGVSLNVLLLGEVSSVYTLLANAKITGNSWRILSAALTLLYMSIAVVWVFAVWRVSRALRSWRARRTVAPLDL